jgi:lycopene elongase/hydratase (dihydrobisanhydrobacterioruberin-forming)
MTELRRLLFISRPRFWIYEAGTYLLGVFVAMNSFADLVRPEVLWYGFFFLVPANLYIYGINDIFDYETDKLNPKKGTYESLVDPSEHRRLWWAIALLNLPFLIGAFFFLPWAAGVSILAFFFFAGFYSAPPIRAKARPFLDSIFSGAHYVMTFVFGYYLLDTMTRFPWEAFLAGMAWTVAMHAFSAVPDIKADREAGLKTIAIIFGARNTIFLCGLLYFLAGVIFMTLLGWTIVFGLALYLFLMILAWGAINDEARLFKIYTYFPILNTVVPLGYSIFFLAQKFTT